MDRIWYYATEGVRHGPVTFDELRALAKTGSLKPLDLVWQPAFGSEWRNAGGVDGLFVKDTPPEVPPVLENARDTSSVPITGVTGSRPSCLGAVSQAFGRMVNLLFRPFDLTRWFSIGFCTWLAYIGTGSSFNYRQSAKEVSGAGLKTQFDQFLNKVAHPSLGTAETSVMIGIVVFALLLAILFCQLRSRGDFMFLHRWYKPNATIGQCWWSSRAAGRELFVWRMYFFVIAFLLFVLNAGYGYVFVLKPYLTAGNVWSGGLAAPTVKCVTGLVLLSVTVQLVAHLTKAFVVPVMYWHGVTASRAWLAVFALCNQYPGAVIGYLLCGIACSFAAGLAILAFGAVTCCIGFIPMVLPYLGAVVLLPYYLFFRGYAVCFLSQWRGDLVPPAA